VTVPPSIQALLAARLDQLPSAERAALERGSVEGQVFHRGAVVALGPDDPNVTSHLSGLVRKELVRPSVATLPGDDAFRFRHLLIRDAAYDALPKAARADLHERFAEWIEERAPDLVELEEILGYHLEQAVRYRTELGAPPADLAARAALCLGAAGTRAAQRQDPPAARNLLSRALDLLPSDSPDRAKLLLPLGRALYQSGELDRALELLGEASAAEGDVALEAGFFLAFVRSHTTGVGLLAAEDEVREKLARAEEAGAGKRALAQGYLSLANLLFFNGKTTEQLAVAARAKDYARRAGDTVLEAQATAQEGSAMLHGPSPWSELEAHARAALADSDRLGFHIRTARTGLAAAAAAQGRFDEARELFAQHGRELEERGHSFRLLSMFHARGVTESAAREFDAAEQYLRDGWDGLGRLGERGYRSTVGGDLAEPLIELGRIDEALEILDEAEAIGAPDDWLTAAQVRASRALAASAVGDHERAVELGRESVEIADAREYVFARTYYWGKYGRVLAAAGRTDEARAALQECLRLAALKGTVIYADEAREILDALPVS
jgi:hypothetical protein